MASAAHPLLAELSEAQRLLKNSRTPRATAALQSAHDDILAELVCDLADAQKLRQLACSRFVKLASQTSSESPKLLTAVGETRVKPFTCFSCTTTLKYTLSASKVMSPIVKPNPGNRITWSACKV